MKMKDLKNMLNQSENHDIYVEEDTMSTQTLFPINKAEFQVIDGKQVLVLGYYWEEIPPLKAKVKRFEDIVDEVIDLGNGKE